MSADQSENNIVLDPAVSAHGSNKNQMKPGAIVVCALDCINQPFMSKKDYVPRNVDGFTEGFQTNIEETARPVESKSVLVQAFSTTVQGIVIQGKPNDDRGKFID